LIKNYALTFDSERDLTFSARKSARQKTKFRSVIQSITIAFYSAAARKLLNRKLDDVSARLAKVIVNGKRFRDIFALGALQAHKRHKASHKACVVFGETLQIQ